MPTEPTESVQTIAAFMPTVSVEVQWGATDGSVPESTVVKWEGHVPPADEICRVIAELVGAPVEDATTLDEPTPDPMDICRRAWCNHPRASHVRGGACNICAEAIPCPGYLRLLLGPAGE